MSICKDGCNHLSLCCCCCCCCCCLSLRPDEGGEQAKREEMQESEGGECERTSPPTRTPTYKEKTHQKVTHTHTLTDTPSKHTSLICSVSLVGSLVVSLLLNASPVCPCVSKKRAVCKARHATDRQREREVVAHMHTEGKQRQADIPTHIHTLTHSHKQ